MRLGLDLRLYGSRQAGLGRYGEAVFNSLMEYGKSLEIVAFINTNYTDKNQFVGYGVETIDCPYRPYSWPEQLYFPAVLKKAGLDLVHFLHFNVPLYYSGPYVVTIHDLIMHHFPWRVTSRRSTAIFLLKHLAYRASMRIVVRRAKFVITVSQYTAEDILTFYPKLSARLRVIPEVATLFKYAPVLARGAESGFDSPNNIPKEIVSTGEVKHRSFNDFRSAADKNILLSYNIRRPYVIMVGNFYPHKNISPVLKAWRRLYPIYGRQLVMIGKMDSFAARHYEEALRLGLMNQSTRDSAVSFLGAVSDEDLRALYKMAEYYLNTSLMEGVGLPCLEALECGTAVISSARGSLPETCGLGAVYIPVDNEEVIFSALKKIFKSSSVKMQTNYKRQSSFTVKDMAALLQSVYEESAA